MCLQGIVVNPDGYGDDTLAKIAVKQADELIKALNENR